MSITITIYHPHHHQVGEHDHCKAQGSFVLASVVHKHPNFDIDSASVDNDIAILKVATKRLTKYDNCYSFQFFLQNLIILSTFQKMTKLDNFVHFQLSKDLTFSDKIKPACLPTNATKDYSGWSKYIDNCLFLL